MAERGVRIAHFTDIHITLAPSEYRWRDFLSKRCVGWANLTLAGRHGVFREAAAVTRAFAADVLQQEADHVLFTGDFTGVSLPAEFREAQEALSGLGGHSVTAIPGNHDVYVPEAVRERYFETFFGDWCISDRESARPPGSPSRAPFPLVRLIGETVALVCLRDVHPRRFHDSSGEVGKAQLDDLERILQQEELANRTRILALHYAPFRADGTPDTRLHGLRDAENLLSLVGRLPVDLIVHGHIHRRFVHPSGTVTAAAVADPGSLTAANGPRAYHVYVIEGGKISIEARRYDAQLGGFVSWPEAPGAGFVHLR